MKDLEIRLQISKEYFNFMRIGKTLQHIKLLYGLMIGTREKLQIDM